MFQTIQVKAYCDQRDTIQRRTFDVAGLAAGIRHLVHSAKHSEKALPQPRTRQYLNSPIRVSAALHTSFHNQ